MSPIGDTKTRLITNALYLNNKSCIQIATILFGAHVLYYSHACKVIGTSLRFLQPRPPDAQESLEFCGAVQRGRCPLDTFLGLPGDEESDERRQSQHTILILIKEMGSEDGVKGMMHWQVFPMATVTEKESVDLAQGRMP